MDKATNFTGNATMNASDESSSSPQVVLSFKLKGHKKSVLCLASAEDGEKLWSGSEDTTCRLFDMRTQRRTAELGILAGDAVLSLQQPHPHQLLVAAGNVVKLFDIRQPNSPLLRDGQNILQAEDEINQILVCDEHNMLIAGDDAGNVYMVDNYAEGSSEPVIQTHESMAMVTSIAHVVPSDEPPIVLSGGTDCTVVAWQGSSRLSSLHIPNSSTNANQICNPPMVHTMAVLPSRHESFRFLCGLGDGSLGVVSLSRDEKQLKLESRIEDVPADAVAKAAHRVGSAGNGSVAIWEHREDGTLQQSLAISHPPKVNAIAWGDINNATLCMADTTMDITCFKTPL